MPLKPSFVAFRIISFEVLRGLRGFMSVNGSPFFGKAGNIRALSGSLTKERSTSPALSGIPAVMRWCFSRTATRTAIKSSSIVDRSLVGFLLRWLEPQAMRLGLLPCPFNTKSLPHGVEIAPPQRQAFVAAAARERQDVD